MDITGFGYLLFFLLVLLAHQLLQSHHQWQKAFLTAASYYFYMTIDWRFAGLLIMFTTVNYAAGEVIARHTNRRLQVWAMTAAIFASLTVLAYFKYLNFFGEMANSLSRWLGGGSLVPFVDVMLPVGISFMTFQAITYPIDLYQGRLKQPCSLMDFALFIAFFPRLLSGPIVRSTQFLPQLQTVPPPVDDTQRLQGLALVLKGLAKKVLIADILGAHIVDPAFADPSAFSSAFLWLALFAYSFQVYMDLSGYTDMALGAARMLGYSLPPNFNRPYMATSVANFWQRWHISMSSFFRDYLYNNLSSAWQAPVYANLLIVFVAIGLWHGAGWNFVVYGCIHGGLVSLEHWRTSQRARSGNARPIYRGLALAARITFIFGIVALTRLLFRGNDLTLAGTYLSSMLRITGGIFPLSTPAALAITTAALLHFTPTCWRDELMSRLENSPPLVVGILFVGLVYVSIALSHGHGGFIYFQF